ncbi:peroxiredoxin family protein [Natrinema versiforme]|uniref:Alkyl hydroperoxide reductase/ Thiol specific antioxidant/ Mal allergen n=1 Tax=Natrinema versiforme JCM 10478 TaxID=1227496 RepID=L9Y994_9EURY|nr:hypothetical protein [Natrinema versiforme]ELY70236.1 hypothetical protein C489_02781 [Natrinema versiforme JCM 10478]
MNRRTLLASTVAMPALVGCLDGGTDEGETEPDEPTEPPFEIATIDASGSEAGTVRVPQSGRVMVLNFTRTECPTSRAQLSRIADVKVALAEEGYTVDGDDPEIRFCSITNGTRGPDPSDEELAAWFDENGGNWPIGRDETGVCNEYYEIDGFPTMLTVDGTGAVQWRDRSSTSGAIFGTARDALEGGETTQDGDNRTGDNTSETVASWES